MKVNHNSKLGGFGPTTACSLRDRPQFPKLFHAGSSPVKPTIRKEVMNIIADIAGQYKALIALTKKMPAGEFVSLGDMVDRGPDSKRVVEWFMKNGKAILGNHEHMMLDFCRRGRYYDSGVWGWNGGDQTLLSYDPDQMKTALEVVPEEHLKWIEGLPLHMVVDGCLLSHSFIQPGMTLEESTKFGRNIWDVGESRIIWNRREPVRRPEYRLQICGHNSQWGLRRFADEQGEYAVCLDDSRKRVLTGLHLPTMEIFQQEYI